MVRPFRYADRELSWLAFNGRVLQEAQDPTVPLGARLDFLAIFSSNLDEFFRVRVASLRALLRLRRRAVDKLDVDPARLLRRIHRVVDRQQALFGEIFRGLLPDLERRGIQLIDEAALDDAESAFLIDDFEKRIRPHLHPLMLDGSEPPFLRNRALYLVVELTPGDGPSVTAARPRLALVEIPSDRLPRFITLPGQRPRRVLFLDDAIRFNLRSLFPGWRIGATCAVKMTRDAELYLEDEFSGNLVAAIRKGLAKREAGLPCRFLYDMHAPWAMIDFLQRRLGLEDADMIQGGRYHNLHDLAGFPRFGLPDMSYPPMPPLPHPELERAPSLLDAIARKDHLLHFPYQAFGPVVRFIEESAADPAVEEIWITLYRVARDSEVVRALVSAARAGKKVTAFIEVKARFDEESNLGFGEQLEAAGVRTFYSLPGLKVHAKLALVVRNDGGVRQELAYLGTGNFNERTATVYADHALLTADTRLTSDVRQVFAFLVGDVEEPRFTHLLVAPFELRRRLYRLIAGEARAARHGRNAGMVLKMNSLEDRKIIRRLYEASNAGVPIDLVVRGICSLIPGRKAQSRRIRARSIVDRFLEHARVFIFHNGGEEMVYLASADWMTRNLSRRVEVAFPIFDPELRAEIRQIIELQLADNIKARALDARMTNRYLRGRTSPVRAQFDFYRRLQLKGLAHSMEGDTNAVMEAAAMAPEAEDGNE